MERTVVETHLHVDVLLEGLRSDVGDEALAHNTVEQPLCEGADEGREGSDDSENDTGPALRGEVTEIYASYGVGKNTEVVNDSLENGGSVRVERREHHTDGSANEAKPEEESGGVCLLEK